MPVHNATGDAWSPASCRAAMLLFSHCAKKVHSQTAVSGVTTTAISEVNYESDFRDPAAMQAG